MSRQLEKSQRGAGEHAALRGHLGCEGLAQERNRAVAAFVLGLVCAEIYVLRLVCRSAGG